MAKSERVFVDSNFFIALVNRQDSTHRLAQNLHEQIRRENPVLILSEYVFLEVVTVVSQRSDRETAVKLGENLRKNYQIILIDQALHHQTWQLFQGIFKKNMSFVDCSCLAVMKREGIKKLLTFDHADFGPLRNQFGFEFY